MSSDWIHCNSCIALPAPNIQFFFSSCGHLICKKCYSIVIEIPRVVCFYNTKFTENGVSPNSCPYCKKGAQFVEINRSLKTDIQMLFRSPRDLAAEYMKNLGTVLDFQQTHRNRLTRANTEQKKRAVKFIGAAQEEVKKRIEAEKRVMTENSEIKCELDRARVQCQKLEALLATRELELERLRTTSFPPATHNYQRSSDSGLGDTPMSSLSFLDAMTSTPLNQSPTRSQHSSGRQRSRDRLDKVFQSSSGSVPSPIIPTPHLATPAMLGLAKKSSAKRSSSENNRRSTSHFVFGHQEAMEMGEGY